MKYKNHIIYSSSYIWFVCMGTNETQKNVNCSSSVKFCDDQLCIEPKRMTTDKHTHSLGLNSSTLNLCVCIVWNNSENNSLVVRVERSTQAVLGIFICTHTWWFHLHITDKDLGPRQKTWVFNSVTETVYQCFGSLSVFLKLGFEQFQPSTKDQGGKGKHNHQGNPTTEWKLEMNTVHTADLWPTTKTKTGQREAEMEGRGWGWREKDRREGEALGENHKKSKNHADRPKVKLTCDVVWKQCLPVSPNLL